MAMPSRDAARAVANWVLIGLIMLFVQVILGGITRLTGSGLSITEWNVITGIVPPISDHQWDIEFAKYQETPQFRLLNADFGLNDFKFIFFWEWLHRFWARMVGVVFLVGFIYLLISGKLHRVMVKPLIILFLLGALQAAVGWIMVMSGLTGDAVYVKPLKLALHFIFAIGLICYTFWFWLQLRERPGGTTAQRGLRNLAWIIIAVIFLQLMYGALMAGGKLANAAPTWPTINGDWIPDSLFASQGGGTEWIENKFTVQFIHRSLAYLLFGFTLIWTLMARRFANMSYDLKKFRNLPLFNVSLQILLGIMTVLLSPDIVANHWVAFDWFALAHQITGMLFLLVMVFILYILQPVRRTL
jgi:cytochrome c oxidase assembly protein subunit 15